MKSEILMQAMEYLDDDLLLEAHEPLPAQKRLLRVLPRYSAIAACFLFLVTIALLLFPHPGGTSVSIAENTMARDASTVLVELPLLSTQNSRGAFGGMEVPLTILEADAETVVSASAGGELLTVDGEEVQSLVLPKGASCTWVIDITMQSSFSLTLRSGGETILFTAAVDPTANVLRIRAQRQ